MFTLLDLFNSYFKIFNVNSQLKGRIYTLIDFVGIAYLSYLTWSYLKNHAYTQGILIGLATLIITYFALINFVYYFTEKTVKWDISPLFDKYVADVEDTTSNNVQFVPASGLYHSDDVLPALVVSKGDDQIHLAKLVEQMRERGLIEDVFDGLSEKAQIQLLKKEQNLVYANDRLDLPYYRLQKHGKQLLVIGGMNEMSAKRIGIVEQVGLQDIGSALEEYDFFVATAGITGGLAHELGRNGLSTVRLPYQLKVELAYKAKEV